MRTIALLVQSCRVVDIGGYRGTYRGFLHTRLVEWHHRRTPLQCSSLVMGHSIPFTDSSLYEPLTKVNRVYESLESVTQKELQNVQEREIRSRNETGTCIWCPTSYRDTVGIKDTRKRVIMYVLRFIVSQKTESTFRKLWWQTGSRPADTAKSCLHLPSLLA